MSGSGFIGKWRYIYAGGFDPDRPFEEQHDPTLVPEKTCASCGHPKRLHGKGRTGCFHGVTYGTRENGSLCDCKGFA